MLANSAKKTNVPAILYARIAAKDAFMKKEKSAISGTSSDKTKRGAVTKFKTAMKINFAIVDNGVEAFLLSKYLPQEAKVFSIFCLAKYQLAINPAKVNKTMAVIKSGRQAC